MRKLGIVAVILLVVAAGVLIVPPLLQQGQSTVNAQTTETAIVERTTLNSTIETNGTVAAEKTINLSFGTSGTVDTLNVQVGDAVTAGQVLGTLDTADLEYQIALEEQSLAVQQSSYNQLIADPTAEEIAQAQANVASAQSQLASAQNSLETAPNQVIVNCSSVDSAQRAFESAQSDYDAYVNEGYEWDATFLPDSDSTAGTALHEAQSSLDVAQAQCSDTTPASQYEIQVMSAQASLEQSQAALDSLLNGPTAEDIASAEAQLQQSQLQLDNARAALADAQIIAPFDGIIAESNVISGEVVTSATAVFMLIDASLLHVDVAVDELDIPQITLGQAVTVVAEALEGVTLNGEVVQISPVATTAEGIVTYSVRVNLVDAAAAQLRVGMTTDVGIIVNTESDVLAVPTDAIQRNGLSEFVLVLNDDGSTTPVTVTTGITVDDLTAVEGDLTEGITVVIPEQTSTGTTGGGFPGPFGG